MKQRKQQRESPKGMLQGGKLAHERGPKTHNRRIFARLKAAGNRRKDPSHTDAVEAKQHTAPNSSKCNRSKSMRLHPELFHNQAVEPILHQMIAEQVICTPVATGVCCVARAHARERAKVMA